MSKRRSCPALGREITAPDCGARRNSELSCPASCSFNPLNPANYDQMMEIDLRLNHWTMQMIKRNPQRVFWYESMLREYAAEALAELVELGHYRAIFYQKDASGLTAAQSWERQGFPDLKNDQRVLMRHKMQIRMGLLEFRRILDSERIEFVDLLRPEQPQLILIDRLSAARACRFDVVLAHYFPLPHYCRVVSGLIFTPFLALGSKEILFEVVQHLGGPLDLREMDVWFTENFRRLSRALQVISILREHRSRQLSDLKYGRAVYRLLQPNAACRSALDSVAEMRQDRISESERREGFSEARVWLDPIPDKIHRKGEPTLGRVLLGQSFWRLEALGEARIHRMQSLFEGTLGSMVACDGLRLDDYQETPSGITEEERKLAPPRLVESASPIMVGMSVGTRGFIDLPETRRQADQAFLDQPIPMLDGKTPREAAADPAMRPRLELLLKSRLNATDRENLREETYFNPAEYDSNAYVRELGFEELCLDPPPARLDPDREDDDADDDADFENDIIDEDETGYADQTGYTLNPEGRPLAPPVPANLSVDQITARVEAHRRSGRDEMLLSGCAWFDDVEGMAPIAIDSGEDMTLCLQIITLVWSIMIPPGTFFPSISPELLDQAMVARLKELDASPPAGHVSLSRYQPILHEQIAGMLIVDESTTIKASERANRFAILALWSAVLIDELHLALQNPPDA